jgi:hypothetical protein
MWKYWVIDGDSSLLRDRRLLSSSTHDVAVGYAIPIEHTSRGYQCALCVSLGFHARNASEFGLALAALPEILSSIPYIEGIHQDIFMCRTEIPQLHVSLELIF